MTLCVAGSNSMPIVDGYANIQRVSEVALAPTVRQSARLHTAVDISYDATMGVQVVPFEADSQIIHNTDLKIQQDATSIVLAVQGAQSQIIVGLSQEHTNESNGEIAVSRATPIIDESSSPNSIPYAPSHVPISTKPTIAVSYTSAAHASVAINLLALFGAGFLWFALLAQMISV